MTDFLIAQIQLIYFPIYPAKKTEFAERLGEGEEAGSRKTMGRSKEHLIMNFFHGNFVF